MLAGSNQHGRGGIGMDKMNLYVPNFLPFKEYFVPEKNQACPGCGLALAVRQTYKALEKEIEKALWQPLMEGGTFAGAADIFGVGKTEVSFLKIPKGKADLILCLDNEAGGSLNETLEKPMVSIAVAEGFSYVATASPSYPFDLFEKIKRGFQTEGKWAVESRAFPLYEVGGGVYRLTLEMPKPRSLADYIKAQKRFENLSEKEIEEAQALVDNGYKKLLDTIQKYIDTTG
jgi:pyruvate/2-oxoacid:ferredoxin oxidoreductase beta subunit